MRKRCGFSDSRNYPRHRLHRRGLHQQGAVGEYGGIGPLYLVGVRKALFKGVQVETGTEAVAEAVGVYARLVEYVGLIDKVGIGRVEAHLEAAHTLAGSHFRGNGKGKTAVDNHKDCQHKIGRAHV